MSSVTMTVRLDQKLLKRLTKLAGSMRRSKSFLANEAILEYVKIQEWQVDQIKQGIAEADAGHLVPHETVVARLEKKLADMLDKKSRK